MDESAKRVTRSGRRPDDEGEADAAADRRRKRGPRAEAAAAATAAVRLQKFLSRAGVASRRAAEELIREGHVSVDGRIVTEMGVSVDPATSVVKVDGREVARPDRLRYYLLDKPRHVVCTLADPEGRRHGPRPDPGRGRPRLPGRAPRLGRRGAYCCSPTTASSPTS